MQAAGLQRIGHHLRRQVGRTAGGAQQVERNTPVRYPGSRRWRLGEGVGVLCVEGGVPVDKGVALAQRLLGRTELVLHFIATRLSVLQLRLQLGLQFGDALVQRLLGARCIIAGSFNRRLRALLSLLQPRLQTLLALPRLAGDHDHGQGVATYLARYLKGGPIKNLELVQELYALAQAKPRLDLRWIRAHEGTRWNEYADALASRWPVKIAYGLTETCAHVAVGDLLRSDRSLILQPGSHVEIVDSQDPPAGGMGFIQITGPTVMAGYANPELVPGDGLAGPQTFRTQDLGRMGSDGRLRVIGRGDDMLISGGLNIHPAQVEDLMAACPGISEVAVVGIPDPVWGSRLAALYCGDVDEAEVSTWAAENIASALRPRDFRRVPSLPRTSLGKLRRGELGRLI
mgnify:CR=1 FL=1